MQNSWQEHILKEFIPQVNRLTLVADPDYLVTEEDILQRLRERGFDILLFEYPVAFRFAYESKYRSKWDNGDTSIELVVVVHEEAANLRLLPYDIFQTDRKLSFSLGDIIPQLKLCCDQVPGSWRPGAPLSRISSVQTGEIRR